MPFQRRISPPRTVHPHACGGYALFTLRAFYVGWFTPTHVGDMQKPYTPHTASCGSPPRMWGILTSIYNSLPEKRFTPTHVGDMMTMATSTSKWAVHPHACGGYAFFLAPAAAHSGSPPRMWGICFAIHPPGVSFSVHPHACGGYATFLFMPRPP